VLAILMKKLKILQDAYNVKVKAFPSRVWGHTVYFLFYPCGVHPVALCIRIPFKYTWDPNWEFIGVTFSLCSQHVSAPTGHLQVKYNYITYISWEIYKHILTITCGRSVGTVRSTMEFVCFNNNKRKTPHYFKTWI
jgi:hypothetical protein